MSRTLIKVLRLLKLDIGQIILEANLAQISYTDDHDNDLRFLTTFSSKKEILLKKLLMVSSKVHHVSLLIINSFSFLQNCFFFSLIPSLIVFKTLIIGVNVTS